MEKSAHVNIAKVSIVIVQSTTKWVTHHAHVLGRSVVSWMKFGFLRKAMQCTSFAVSHFHFLSLNWWTNACFYDKNLHTGCGLPTLPIAHSLIGPFIRSMEKDSAVAIFQTRPQSGSHTQTPEQRALVIWPSFKILGGVEDEKKLWESLCIKIVQWQTGKVTQLTLKVL